MSNDGTELFMASAAIEQFVKVLGMALLVVSSLKHQKTSVGDPGLVRAELLKLLMHQVMWSNLKNGWLHIHTAPESNTGS